MPARGCSFCAANRCVSACNFSTPIDTFAQFVMRDTTGTHAAVSQHDRSRADRSTRRSDGSLALSVWLRAGFSGAPSPDTRGAGKLVNFVFALRQTPSGREAHEASCGCEHFLFSAWSLSVWAATPGRRSWAWRRLYGAQGLTAAHRSLPMGSRVRVLNLDNGRSVIVRIVDRGPFIHGRVIDVSTAAAVALGFRDAGLAYVRIERISAETLEASAGPSRPAAPASDETSSYAICSYGADRVEHLRTDSVGDRAAPL